jgi:UDP-2,3-diacylglucosamine pyrophosphatase LpxH
VIHVDTFDAALKHTQRLAFLGGSAMRATTAVNAGLNFARRLLGLSHWSLSQWAKLKVKSATNYLSDYEQGLAALARRHHVDGVICGHVHHATIHEDLGVRYINCGDWIESCTAVAEHGNGSFEIVTWHDRGTRQNRTVMVSEARPARTSWSRPTLGSLKSTASSVHSSRSPTRCASSMRPSRS